MKRKMINTLVCFIFAGLFAIIPSIVFANSACDEITITHIGMSPASPSGVEIWLDNESGKECTDIPIGPPIQTFLSAKNDTKMLTSS